MGGCRVVVLLVAVSAEMVRRANRVEKKRRLAGSRGF